MPAKLFCVTGPTASGKTQFLLNRFREYAAEGAGLWLAPSEWACKEIFSRLNVLTLPELARQIVRGAEPNSRILPELHQQLLLDGILRDLAAQKRLPFHAGLVNQAGFRKAVYDFITELKGQVIEPEFFAAAVRQADQIDNEKALAIARVFAQYHERLIERGLFDRQTTYERARQLWAAGCPGPFASVRAIFLDGFVDFSPPQLQLLTAIAATVDQVWISLLADRHGDESRAELMSRPKATIAKLHQLFAGTVSEVVTDRQSPPPAPRRPAGLDHLERSLFRPEPPSLAAVADGLLIMEAPGVLGEVRLVARAVKTLLRDGTAANRILMTARDLGPYADLVREVFADYGLPVLVEGTDALIRNLAVSVLLRATPLLEDDFPFGPTTALLRNTYFNPAWPEIEADPEVAARTDRLLRLLGEPRGRSAYLQSAAIWAKEMPPGLEDERAEESRRRRKHDLAKRCLPFLERFLRSWDGMPIRGDLASFVDWLRGFAADMGLAAEAERTDAVEWARFWDELDELVAQQMNIHSRPAIYDRPGFSRLLTAVTTSVGMVRTPIGNVEEPNGWPVRMLSADRARHLDCDHLFILGMGERSFPRMETGSPLFDESERQAFRGAGLDVRAAAERLPDEMLLFYQLVTRPRERLVLSYPAVDAKGQPLLPGTFLSDCFECFEKGVVPVERQRMLIEGFDRRPPLSPAEYRVRWAACDLVPQDSGLPADLSAHLHAARRIATARRDKEFSSYNGMLRSGGVLNDLSARFGAKKVFSPTALESYIACPFRFYLEDVLGLEALEEPAEEVEPARRGAAVHRALSRLHARLKVDGVDGPGGELPKEFADQLHAAVEEDAARVASPAAKMLWRLEGKRLSRAASRYGFHWEDYQKPWQGPGLVPKPFAFEIDFGLEAASDPLIVRFGEIEVRIGGRIDRLDTAKLDDGTVGFWVIDYKTGRSSHHTATDLAAFKKLQLSLYALAAERFLVPGGRPLGLVYWLVSENGAKIAMPGRRFAAWHEAADRWPRFRDELERWVATLVTNIRQGVFPLKPRSEDCTSTCAFGQVCRIADSRAIERSWDLPLPVVGPGDGANTDE